MIPNAFIGHPAAPSDSDLTAALGAAKALWDQLLVDLAGEFDLTEHEWKSTSPKHGWSLRVQRGMRNILYLSPCQGSFRVAFILGDRAVDAARTSGLEVVLRLLDGAERYPEGTGIRLDATGPAELAVIKALTKLKLEH